MRKVGIAVAAMTLAAGMVALGQGRVLLVPREGAYSDLDLMLTREVDVMITKLQAAGYHVAVACVSGDPFVGQRVTLKTDLKLSDVRISDYDGLIMPCMAVGTPGPLPADAVRIVKEASSLGMPIAAQYGSVFILAEAGILSGKRYASNFHRIPQGTYGGTGIVQDGDIITSGTCPYSAQYYGRPDGTAELTDVFIRALASRPRDKKSG